MQTPNGTLSDTSVTGYLHSVPYDLIFDRIEVNYEKDMWLCYVLDRSRDGPYAVFRKYMDCSDDYMCAVGLRL